MLQVRIQQAGLKFCNSYSSGSREDPSFRMQKREAVQSNSLPFIFIDYLNYRSLVRMVLRASFKRPRSLSPILGAFA
jgi:hypothetical protein